MGVVAPGVSVGAMGCGTIRRKQHGKHVCIKKAIVYKMCSLLTYCNHCRANHSAGKMSRQSYNGDGISETTLWLRDGYREVCCTLTSILTALVCSIIVVYTIPSGP